jgi:hypothetical protein
MKPLLKFIMRLPTTINCGHSPQKRDRYAIHARWVWPLYLLGAVMSGHTPLPFRDERIGWSNFLEKRELLLPLIQAGQDGRGPRGFFGGPAPDTHGKPNAACGACPNISFELSRLLRENLMRFVGQ